MAGARNRRSTVSIPGELPRLFFKNGRSARTSNGFLFVVTRVTSSNMGFKQTASRISRRTALFEPRQMYGRAKFDLLRLGVLPIG